MNRVKSVVWRVLLICLICNISSLRGQQVDNQLDDETIKSLLSSPSQKDLYTWLSYLTSEELGGRMTGSEGYRKAADYVADFFKEWGLHPIGDDNTYLQAFSHPYTSVNGMGHFALHIPVGKDTITKTYDYPDNYIPGGCSDFGSIDRASLAYVGYGITAPELKYDDYAGINVKGKIVVCDPGTPYSGDDIDREEEWYTHGMLNTKLKNALKHGAVGLLYISNKAAVSAGHVEGIIYAHISDKIVSDLFSGTSKNHKTLIAERKAKIKPNSFALDKTADLFADTEYHPEGIGYNVVGMIEGSDPTLKSEVLIAGAHLDHLGRLPVTMPGALDNGSGSVIMMSVAKALATSGFKPKRSILFILYGGEETGLNGSTHFINNPLVPMDKIKVIFNIDMLGTGYGLYAHIAPKYKPMLNYVANANNKYVHRPYEERLGADRIVNMYTDGDAFFKKTGKPVIALLSFGSKTPSPYHRPNDTVDLINFDIVQDAVKLQLMSLIEMAQAADL